MTNFDDEAEKLKADLLDALAILEHVRAIWSAPAALSVPYRSQWEDDAALFSSDCGPACVAMLVQAATGERVPIDRLAAECDMSAAHQSTLAEDLIRGGAAHGVKLACLVVTSIEMARLPCIALVHYDDLPRLDVKYTSGHWVVVTQNANRQIVYHDPDYWGVQMWQGANRVVPVETFDQAMRDCKLDKGNPPGLVLVMP